MVSTPYGMKKKLVYNSEFKNKLDFFENNAIDSITFPPTSTYDH